MANKSYVYFYSDPSRGNEIFYVGMGQGGRARRHFTRTDKHPMTNRMTSLKSKSVIPNIGYFCKDVDSEFAALVEQEAIAKYGRRDLNRGPLLNLTDGGDGCYNPSPETRARMSAARKGIKQDPNVVEKRAATMRGKSRPPHVIAACVAANTGATRSDESRKRMSEAQKGKTQTAEHKARISEGLRLAHARKKLNGK